MHKRWLDGKTGVKTLNGKTGVKTLDGKTGVKTLNGKNVGHQRQTIRAQMLQTASIQKNVLAWITKIV